MRDNRFDVVPMAECGEVPSYYFQTRLPGNFDGSPEQKKICSIDKIPYTAPLRYVICKFATEKRSFYFLEDGEQVVGLISEANLNCRQVKTYLHELLCGLEMSLCDFLADCSESILRDALGPSNKAVELYDEERADNTEVSLLECMYLSDLIKAVRKTKRFVHLCFPSGEKFTKAVDPLVDLRNEVMHAERPLVGRNRDAADLWKLIKAAEDLSSRLTPPKTAAATA